MQEHVGRSCAREKKGGGEEKGKERVGEGVGEGGSECIRRRESKRSSELAKNFEPGLDHRCVFCIAKQSTMIYKVCFCQRRCPTEPVGEGIRLELYI